MIGKRALAIAVLSLTVGLALGCKKPADESEGSVAEEAILPLALELEIRQGMKSSTGVEETVAKLVLDGDALSLGWASASGESPPSGEATIDDKVRQRMVKIVTQTALVAAETYHDPEGDGRFARVTGYVELDGDRVELDLGIDQDVPLSARDDAGKLAIFYVDAALALLAESGRVLSEN